MIDFDRFLCLVQDDRRPYPWQREFATRSAANRPPETVAVPTGCGKTTVVEALVWALARQAERPALKRTVGVRLVWAIDRRILVDEVFSQADRLAELLNASWKAGDSSDPLFEVARRLQHLKDPQGQVPSAELGPPLVATRWRGGIVISPPARHPLQPEIITSTVGQIGSRILFRGYGLGSGSRPTGAALAACDTTICLDEAHLAEPFAETVNAIAKRRHEKIDPVAPSVSIVRLSATIAPGNADQESDVIKLSDDDEAKLSRRLEAPKRATLVEPEGQTDNEQVAALVAGVSDHLESDKLTVACICNSVRTARAVFDRIAKIRKEADSMLLVGPQRPADREGIFEARVAADDAAAAEDRPSRREVLFEGARTETPLVLVATQTVEVGLDMDVEAMVTQSASAGALVQRFGRLNRSGVPGVTGEATVVRQREFPLYELDEDNAWNWLRALPSVDGSGAVDISVRSLLDHPPPPPLRRNPTAPITDDIVSRLVETSPLPHEMAEPDIDVYLRGVHSKPNGDVALFWRSDLHESDADADSYRDALLRLAPPSRSEQLSVSIGAARNLLRRLTGAIGANGTALRRMVLDGADLEGDGPEEARYRSDPEPEGFEGIPFFVLRDKKWRSGQNDLSSSTETIGIHALRPGDVIAIPTALGGVDEFGLSTDARTGTDVGDDVRPGAAPGPGPIRITRGALIEAYEGAHPEKGSRAQLVEGHMRRVRQLANRIDAATPGTVEANQLMRDLFGVLGEHPQIGRLKPESAELRWLTSPASPEMVGLIEDREKAGSIDGSDGFESIQEMEPGQGSSGFTVFTGEQEDPSPPEGWVLVPLGEDLDELRPQSIEPPTLAAHCRAVSERVEQFAHAAGLGPGLTATVTLAGLAHDLGKADPRMQGLFHGGVNPAVAEPLAKSTFGTRDRSADDMARRISGMPRSLRHEQASVGILSEAIESGCVETLSYGEIDLELVLYLVGAHHGRNHPIPPVPTGGSPPRSYRIELNGLKGGATGVGDEGWSGGESLSRADRLRGELGPWTLAYLEALLIMADRTVSAEGK